MISPYKAAPFHSRLSLPIKDIRNNHHRFFVDKLSRITGIFSNFNIAELSLSSVKYRAGLLAKKSHISLSFSLIVIGFSSFSSFSSDGSTCSDRDERYSTENA